MRSPRDRKDAEESGAPGGNVDRRRFVKTVGAAGVLGAVGGLGAGVRPEAGMTAVPNRGPARGGARDDFPAPEGLRPGAQLDSRFPVSFQGTVTEGYRLMTEYFTALARRDLEGIAETLHFPFAIYEDIEPLVFESRDAFLDSPPPSLNFGGSGVGRTHPDSYDLLEGIDVHLYCPVGGVFSVAFERWSPDGHKLFDCEGIFSVTNNDWRWGIHLASMIVHERGYEGQTYPGAAEMDIIGSQGYMAQFGYRNEDVLDDPHAGRGRYLPRLPAGTPTAGVSFGYGPRDRSRNARENRPMEGWRVSGITNRLTVGQVSELSPDASLNTNLDEFVDLAGGTVGEYGYTRIPPHANRVIHQTHDKAHTMGGYWRFTHDGTFISETRSVGIQIYRGGVWGSAGGLGQVTHHDRSNSVG